MTIPIPTSIDDGKNPRACSPVCMRCVHLTIGEAGGLASLACKAFPGRIPGEIWSGKFDHREAYPGDNGVRFEEVK